MHRFSILDEKNVQDYEQFNVARLVYGVIRFRWHHVKMLFLKNSMQFCVGNFENIMCK